MKRAQTTAAVLLLLALLSGFLLELTAFFHGGAFRSELGSLRRDPSELPAFLQKAEGAVNQDLDRHHLFIQLFGGVQRLMGRQIVEDMAPGNTIARLKTGALNFIKLESTPVDTLPNAQATAGLQQALERLDIPFLYLQAPQKIQRGTDLLPTGVYDYGNQNADLYLSGLAQEGVAYLDLRPLFEASDDYAGWFFRTDHHWKPEAALFALQYLVPQLQTQYGLAFDTTVLDEARYDKIVYEDFFLGSQGKRVGTLYAGTDDFSRYSPRFETSLTYSVPFYQIERSGSFDQSVLFLERVASRDLFLGNPYTLYAGGDYPLATITNHLNPDGPKLLLIRDSFSCVIAPFLALACSELTTVDLRQLNTGLLETIEAVHPDLVLMLYTTGSAALDEMFSFD